MIAHAVWRAFLLVALGIILSSGSSARTNFTFEDTLTQIGLGYPFVFLVYLMGRRFGAWPVVYLVALVAIGEGRLARSLCNRIWQRRRVKASGERSPSRRAARSTS